MLRPTKSQINDEILEQAATLFARHGYERTSLQQLAAALGYSKAGLLHHYPSKKALYDAVVDRYVSVSGERIAEFAQFPPGIERDRAMLVSIIEQTYQWPGMSEFGHYLSNHDGDPRVTKMGLQLIVALGIDFTKPDLERMVRTFSAMAGANLTARLAVRMHMESEWRDHILTTAMNALGHWDDAAQ